MAQPLRCNLWILAVRCQELCGEPFRLYKEIPPGPLSFADLGHYRDVSEISAFCTSVADWAGRWNLTAEWCKEAAYSTLQRWAWWGPDPELAFWHPATINMMRRVAPPESLPVYQHEFGRQEYSAAIREAVRQACKSHELLKYGNISHLKEFVESIIESPAVGRLVEEYCARVEAETVPTTLRRDERDIYILPGPREFTSKATRKRTSSMT